MCFIYWFWLSKKLEGGKGRMLAISTAINNGKTTFTQTSIARSRIQILSIVEVHRMNESLFIYIPTHASLTAYIYMLYAVFVVMRLLAFAHALAPATGIDKQHADGRAQASNAAPCLPCSGVLSKGHESHLIVAGPCVYWVYWWSRRVCCDAMRSDGCGDVLCLCTIRKLIESTCCSTATQRVMLYKLRTTPTDADCVVVCWSHREWLGSLSVDGWTFGQLLFLCGVNNMPG